MGIPGKGLRQAADQVTAAARDASGFMWAVLALASAALLLGAVALIRSAGSARA